MSRAAKRRRKAMMMESQPLPPSEEGTINPAPKNSLRKKALIILFILEACFIIAFFFLKAKTNSFHLGYFIDETFLNKLVEREQYSTLLRISLAFFISFGLGIILHIFKVLPPRKDNKEPTLNKFIFEFVILVLLAIGVSIPQVIEIPARFTQKPTLQKEILIDKDTWTSRSGMHYDLIFSSKSSITVSKRTYMAAHTGTEYYTVYQGSFLIDYFPTDRYFLRKE
ncbi:hypothetical protein [Fibrobacter sp. UWB11]|uniref:hypothetical protein n=1 Tax=Fibrobacter sp. UWB11 TaxID=1896202 RepID=UPI00094108CE|nr:hypothetical protein [Fibrobacter sp. UWB11]